MIPACICGGLFVGGVWLGLRREAANDCRIAIAKLEYIEENGSKMNPPATISEMFEVNVALLEHRRYMASWWINPYPPTVDWLSLPMDEAYAKKFT